MKARINMSLLQQLVKQVEVCDAEGTECQLTDVKVEDNHITARLKLDTELNEFELDERVIDLINITLYLKIWINIYDDDVTLNERVEIREVEQSLETVIINESSESVLELSDKVAKYLTESYQSRNVAIADIYAYVTFASLV
jgi:hypothetical protein